MLRTFVMWIAGLLGWLPSRVMLVLIILGSLVIYELGSFFIKKIIKIIKNNKYGIMK